MERRRLLAPLAAALALAATVAPAAAARHGRLHATYTGRGSGAVQGTHASGSATMSGHGTVVGTSTFAGSGSGDVSTPPCLHITGTGTIRSARGTIALSSVPGATVCVTAASGESGSFRGKAKISGGSGTFAHARGTLSFSGSFHGQTVTITLTGRVTY